MGRSIDESFHDDHDDARSFRSLDLEEAKAMLQDTPETSFFRSGNRRRLKDFLYPCSITTNLVLFAFLLAVLGNPCYFSSRTCLYPKAESSNTSLKLLGEVHDLVPDCKSENIDVAVQPLIGNSRSGKSCFHERLQICKRRYVQRCKRIRKNTKEVGRRYAK